MRVLPHLRVGWGHKPPRSVPKRVYKEGLISLFADSIPDPASEKLGWFNFSVYKAKMVRDGEIETTKVSFRL